ncbi:type II toxin-antitoxin system prevent-host-death family antitoxin [Synechococcus sp. CCY 0621]|jgi:prevent-host-death family protein|uniref:type II toxin-antitoxin system Phd/YefM family antitoxin n=1 Tax=Synechococcus sp. CCY 0621 TaxID=2815603 RepID=UPI001C22DCC2|nr:type II toxin-antitoxin system prevent-host-death family antitoxin [Synechococcus sp. CCY 0621]
MQVNMLEAKSQLSKLVKAALAGEDVVIASHGDPQVRLVPCAQSRGLKHLGVLAGDLAHLDRPSIDVAFSPEADAEVQRLMGH